MSIYLSVYPLRPTHLLRQRLARIYAKPFKNSTQAALQYVSTASGALSVRHTHMAGRPIPGPVHRIQGEELDLVNIGLGYKNATPQST